MELGEVRAALDDLLLDLEKVVLAPVGGLDSIIADKAPVLHTFFNSLSQSIFLEVLFWVCVGCIIYIFILLACFFYN